MWICGALAGINAVEVIRTVAERDWTGAYISGAATGVMLSSILYLALAIREDQR